MSLHHHINQVNQLITQASKESQRELGEVLLLAVTKQQSIETIKEAHKLGLSHFAENYVQEALPKIEQLKQYPLVWHFIGPIQSNKAKAIAMHFDWVHSINRIEIAQALNKHRPTQKPPLQVCIQINLVDEPTKSGIPTEEAQTLAQKISLLPNLQLRGLMTIPPPVGPNHYELYLQLNKLMQELNATLDLNMDTLSMGMSDDIMPAIKAGSTIVRVGRALFGERT